MPYGRLDIFWPDGVIKSFMLSGQSTSVGRSAGNTLTLENATISRYHLSLTVDAGQVYATDLDSVNGTYVDGVKLTANERHALYGGEEILIGNLRIIYHYLAESDTQVIPAIDEITQRIALALPEFRIDLNAPLQAVAPGAYVTAELSVENTGPEERRFTVEVDGLPKEWVRIDRPAPLIEAGETTFILITFKPLRQPDSRPGNYQIRIRVYPQDQTDAILESPLALRLMPFHGFGLTLDRSQIAGSQAFQLNLHNQGNSHLPVSITGSDRAEQLVFDMLTSQITLAPGQHMTVQGSIRPRQQSLFGKPRQHPFDLRVQSLDHAGFVAAVRGYYTEMPPLPGWGALALLVAAGALALVVLVALVLIITTPPPEPVIASLSFNSPQIARGEPLEVRWQATDAAEMRVIVNGTPVFTTTDTQTTSTTLDTSALAGPVNLVVEAANGDRLAVRGETVLVYEPLLLQRFTATPPLLLRFVVQALVVDWEVSGAVASSVAAPEVFTPNLLESAGSGGRFEIVGIPTDSFTLTLLARDAADNVLEQTLVVNLNNPECVPAAGPVELRAGPDPAHQVIGSVPAGVAVVVDARDQSGAWLRVPSLTSGVSGWGQQEVFTCSGFNPADLRTELNVPPPPTPTASPTPAPTATTAPPSVTPGPSPTTAG